MLAILLGCCIVLTLVVTGVLGVAAEVLSTWLGGAAEMGGRRQP